MIGNFTGFRKCSHTQKHAASNMLKHFCSVFQDDRLLLDLKPGFCAKILPDIHHLRKQGHSPSKIMVTVFLIDFTQHGMSINAPALSTL